MNAAHTGRDCTDNLPLVLSSNHPLYHALSWIVTRRFLRETAPAAVGPSGPLLTGGLLVRIQPEEPIPRSRSVLASQAVFSHAASRFARRERVRSQPEEPAPSCENPSTSVTDPGRSSGRRLECAHQVTTNSDPTENAAARRIASGPSVLTFRHVLRVG
jgi:hypothetical protein